MEIQKLELSDVLIIKSERLGDERGFFSEVFRKDKFESVVGPVEFVQDNHSRTARKGTLRGLHFQAPPYEQGKLVRVTRGSVIDVAVDIRRQSPTYGRHVMVELSAENWNQLWIPPGFLHGFCTITDDVEFLYKVTNFYNKESDGVVAFDDPDLGIDWPFPVEQMILSAKDRAAPRLRDIHPIF